MHEIFILIIIVVILLLGGDKYLEYQCNNYQEMTNKQVEYKNLDSCYVKVNNNWQRWDEYISRSATNQSEGE